MANATFGPDRNTRPGKFKPPAHACDVHAHVFGPVSKFPYAANRRYTPPDATFEDYRAMHGVLGIERGVLTQPTPYGTDNSALLDALERGQGKLRGIVGVLPANLNDKEISRLDALGVRGVRVHLANPEGPNDADVEALADRIRGTDWRIEIVAHDIESYVGLRPRIEKLGVTFSFDQMGRALPTKGENDPLFKQLLAMLRDNLIWIKLSHAYRVTEAGPPYTDTTAIARALVAANPSRCLWGTDWPHPSNPWPIPNDGDLLDLLLDWIPDEATRNKVLVDNPAALNRFS